MREIEVGIRIDKTDGLSFFGAEDVNELLRAGARVVAIVPGGAIMRKLGEDAGNVQLTCSRALSFGHQWMILGIHRPTKYGSGPTTPSRRSRVRISISPSNGLVTKRRCCNARPTFTALSGAVSCTYFTSSLAVRCNLVFNRRHGQSSTALSSTVTIIDIRTSRPGSSDRVI